MSVSEKQTIEIVKVLYRGADILILDEPTAVLTPQETDRLFDVMRNMKADGKAMVIITHKLHEVMDVSDRVAVLRKGKYSGDVATSETSPQALTDMMVGHAVSLNINRPDPKDPTPRLEVSGLTVYDALGVKRLDNVSFTAMGGEILGIAGLAASFFYEFNNPNPIAIVSLLLSFVAAFLASALGGLLYSFLTITLRANQNVTGLTLTIFGGGVANFFGGSLNTMAGGVGQISVATASGIYRANINNFTDFGAAGRLFLSYGFMVYLAIVVAIIMSWFLNRTRTGLNLRAVGENPATADAAGINVTRYKYMATCIGAGISGMGGLYYTMDYIKGTWANDGTIESLGWLAVALVIFATWRSLNAIWGSYLFGLLFWVYMIIPGLGRKDIELFKMLPYLVTILVLIAISLRKKRENQPPASLGLPYFREER